MMKIFTNENKIISILLIVLAVVIVGAVYYYAVYPKSETKVQLTATVDSLKNDINVLEQEVLQADFVKASTEDEFELRKKLPAQKEISPLLLALQEIELVSDAKIKEIIFNEYDSSVASSDLTENLGQDEERDTEEEADVQVNNEEAEEELPVTNIDVSSLPETLKLISLQVEMSVQNHDDLVKVIQEIEKHERVIRIDSIHYTQEGEEGLALPEPDESFDVTIQLTTFYSEAEGG